MPNINKEEELWPWEYTSKEGGNFKWWKGNQITRKQLEDLLSKTHSAEFGAYVVINNWTVHSLIFETHTAGNPNDNVYARWDCLNGWTTTIEEAKKKWPEGLHGQLPTWRMDNSANVFC